MVLIRPALYLLLFIAAFTLYISNGQVMSSYDSAPNSLLAFNVLERHTFDLDPFRQSYFDELGGQYAFTEAPNGHLTSIFPIGTAILTFPLYLGFYLHEMRTNGTPEITARSFEPRRQHYEKEAAAAVAALCVVLFLLCARMLGTPFQAGVATFTFAAATSMWTIASQGLWQHGPVNLLVLVTLFLILHANRDDRGPAWRALWLFLAGIAAGLLPVIRPTALLFTLAALLFVVWAFRKRSWTFVPGFFIAMVPGIAWNIYFFHSIIGGYASNTGEFSLSVASAALGLTGLLFSPSRGLFVFAPVLLFSIAGVWRASHSRSSDARLILTFAAASVMLVLAYAFYRQWWGGQVYGPRFLTDVAAIGCLSLVYALPPDPKSFLKGAGAQRVAAFIFAVTLLWSVAVQYAGATSGAAGSDWNAVPMSVDQDPQRLWALHDNQIVRNIRAAYYKDFAWDITLKPGYREGLSVHLAPEPLPAFLKRGTVVPVRVVVRNVGSTPAYGYESGVFLGQVRIRARVLTPDHHVASQQYLYLAESPQPGQQGSAIGAIVLPPAPGVYNIVLDLVALGLGAVKNSGPPLTIALKVT